MGQDAEKETEYFSFFLTRFKLPFKFQDHWQL